jgi:hypothetical protein
MSISIHEMRDARMGAAVSNKIAAREWLRRLATTTFAFHLDDDIVGIYGSPSAEKYLSKKRDEVLAVLGEKDAWRTYWAALVKAKKVPKGPVRRNPSLPPELLQHHARWVVIGPRGGVISWHETQAEAKRSAKRGDRVVAASSMRLPKSNPRRMDPALKAALADVVRLRRR